MSAVIVGAWMRGGLVFIVSEDAWWITGTSMKVIGAVHYVGQQGDGGLQPYVDEARKSFSSFCSRPQFNAAIATGSCETSKGRKMKLTIAGPRRCTFSIRGG
jgi:hypothetical protein